MRLQLGLLNFHCQRGCLGSNKLIFTFKCKLTDRNREFSPLSNQFEIKILKSFYTEELNADTQEPLLVGGLCEDSCLNVALPFYEAPQESCFT